MGRHNVAGKDRKDRILFSSSDLPPSRYSCTMDTASLAPINSSSSCSTSSVLSLHNDCTKEMDAHKGIHMLHLGAGPSAFVFLGWYC